MIDGHMIREARIARHLTQAELAAGITTRSRIGLIENNKNIPRDKMLRAIISRLNIDYKDVVFNSNESTLQSLDELVFDGHYNKVSAQLKQLQRHINNDHDRLHALFLQAYTNRCRTADNRQALLDFQNILAVGGNDLTDLFAILTIEQLGMTYYADGDLTKADFYLAQFPELLPQFQSGPELHWVAFIYNDLAHYYSDLKKYELSTELAKQALQLLKEHKRTFFIDSLSLVIGKNIAALNGWQDTQASDYLVQAWTFATFTLNTTRAKSLKAVLAKHQITVA